MSGRRIARTLASPRHHQQETTRDGNVPLQTRRLVVQAPATGPRGTGSSSSRSSARPPRPSAARPTTPSRCPAPSPSARRICSRRSSRVPAAPPPAWSTRPRRASRSPTRDNRAAVMESVERARHAAEVDRRSSTRTRRRPSPRTGAIGFADVIYPVPAGEISEETRDELAEVAEPARDAGLQVEFGGGLVNDQEEAGSESMGMMVAYVVLAITLGSLLAAGLPLITAIFGVAIGITGLTALSGVDGRSPRPPRSSPRCSASRSASTTRCSSSPATGRTSATGMGVPSRPRRRPRPRAAPSSSPARPW